MVVTDWSNQNPLELKSMRVTTALFILAFFQGFCNALIFRAKHIKAYNYATENGLLLSIVNKLNVRTVLLGKCLAPPQILNTAHVEGGKNSFISLLGTTLSRIGGEIITLFDLLMTSLLTVELGKHFFSMRCT